MHWINYFVTEVLSVALYTALIAAGCIAVIVIANNDEKASDERR